MPAGNPGEKEEAMPQPHTASEDDVTYSDECRDRIEQRIIRAYVRLAAPVDGAGGCRTVTLGRMGDVEIRLTEAPQEARPDLPPFWLEIHSLETGAAIDSLGCFEFDEDELTRAVDFVCEGTKRHRTRH
jgi:hypothetical protein